MNINYVQRMDFYMKKRLSAAIITILAVYGSIFMSGCNDFSFNPIGKWENIETKTTDGAEVLDPYDQKFYLVFRHDGTAYMMLGDQYISKSELSYTYDDEKVIVKSKEDNRGSAEYVVKENGTVIESVSGGIVNVYKRV